MDVGPEKVFDSLDHHLSDAHFCRFIYLFIFFNVIQVMFMKGFKMSGKFVILFNGKLDVDLKRCLIAQISISLMHRSEIETNLNEIKMMCLKTLRMYGKFVINQRVY